MAKKLITGAPPGPAAVTQWAVNRIYAEMQRLKNGFCKGADKNIAKLRKHGVRLPEMKGWSCDQKVAFFAATGPVGFATLAVGELTADQVSKLARQITPNLKRAEEAVKDFSRSLRIPLPKLEFPEVGGTARTLWRRAGLGGSASGPFRLERLR